MPLKQPKSLEFEEYKTQTFFRYTQIVTSHWLGQLSATHGGSALLQYGQAFDRVTCPVLWELQQCVRRCSTCRWSSLRMFHPLKRHMSGGPAAQTAHLGSQTPSAKCCWRLLEGRTAGGLRPWNFCFLPECRSTRQTPTKKRYALKIRLHIQHLVAMINAYTDNRRSTEYWHLHHTLIRDFGFMQHLSCVVNQEVPTAGCLPESKPGWYIIAAVDCQSRNSDPLSRYAEN